MFELSGVRINEYSGVTLILLQIYRIRGVVRISSLACYHFPFFLSLVVSLSPLLLAIVHGGHRSSVVRLSSIPFLPVERFWGSPLL